MVPLIKSCSKQFDSVHVYANFVISVLVTFTVAFLPDTWTTIRASPTRLVTATCCWHNARFRIRTMGSDTLSNSGTALKVSVCDELVKVIIGIGVSNCAADLVNVSFGVGWTWISCGFSRCFSSCESTGICSCACESSSDFACSVD